MDEMLGREYERECKCGAVVNVKLPFYRDIQTLVPCPSCSALLYLDRVVKTGAVKKDAPSHGQA